MKKIFIREATSKATYKPNFYQHAKKLVAIKNMKNLILIYQMLLWQETTCSLLDKLRSHIFGNIIEIGSKFYLQSQGIGQGSVISTMLCNLYYGDMESKNLTVSKNEILMRQVDDFLFVTPNRSSAIAFLELMPNGFPEYNCCINKEKTLFKIFNFEYFDKTVEQVSATTQFPWCGILIDTETLNVKVDYSRYGGLSTSDTMSVDGSQHPGLSLKNKLIFSMRSKCHKLFLDATINSFHTVVENI